MKNSPSGREEIKNVCKCGHPYNEHFDASYGCGHDLKPELAEGLTNYCYHCEEDSTWQEKELI